jgi:hypothetical protein
VDSVSPDTTAQKIKRKIKRSTNRERERNRRIHKQTTRYLYFQNKKMILLVGGGVQLRPLGRATTDWPIVACPGWLWWWRIWWNKDLQGKPKYSEETCSSATLSTTSPTWPDPGWNPGRRVGKPATNRLSYGAAYKKMMPPVVVYIVIVTPVKYVCLTASRCSVQVTGLGCNLATSFPIIWICTGEACRRGIDLGLLQHMWDMWVSRYEYIHYFVLRCDAVQ